MPKWLFFDQRKKAGFPLAFTEDTLPGKGFSLADALKTRCQAHPKKLALPESCDLRILEAARRILLAEAASEVFLFTERGKTLKLAEAGGIFLDPVASKLRWVGELMPDVPSQVAASLALKLKEKGRPVEQLEEKSIDPLMQAGELLYQGVVDAVVAGAEATTANVIRSAISSVGLARGIRTVSGAFIMDGAPSQPQLPFHQWEHKTYLYADCGVVVEPTADQLCDIATSTVSTWRTLFPVSPEPILAFLSFSTKGSAEHASAAKVAAATKRFKEKFPEILVDGEIQFDAAFDQTVGRKKAPESPVPGAANCFIFPNLDAGNIAYKITQRLAGFTAIGPILQGLAKPYSDLSRGASAGDIELAGYINMLRAP